jgi:hypothetical protein
MFTVGREEETPVAMATPIELFVFYQESNSSLHVSVLPFQTCIPLSSTGAVKVKSFLESFETEPELDRWKAWRE